jgi:Domain of unknown function (DUF5658)
MAGLKGNQKRPMVRKKITNILFIVVAILQVFDGILTYIGTTYYGPAAEGNALIQRLMVNFGVIPSLLIVKLIAISMIYLVYRINKTTLIKKRLFIPLIFVTGLYVWAVVVWVFVLLSVPS